MRGGKYIALYNRSLGICDNKYLSKVRREAKWNKAL